MADETKEPGMEGGEPQELPVSQGEAENWVAKLEEKGEARIAQDRGRMGIILGKIYISDTFKALKTENEAGQEEWRVETELFENLYRGMSLVQALRYHPQSVELYCHHIRNSFDSYVGYLLTKQKELYLGDLVAKYFEGEWENVQREESEGLDFEGKYNLLRGGGKFHTHREPAFSDDLSERIKSGFVPNEASEAASKDRTVIEDQIVHICYALDNNRIIRSKIAKQAEEMALRKAKKIEEEVFGPA